MRPSGGRLFTERTELRHVLGRLGSQEQNALTQAAFRTSDGGTHDRAAHDDGSARMTDVTAGVVRATWVPS